MAEFSPPPWPLDPAGDASGGWSSRSRRLVISSPLVAPSGAELGRAAAAALAGAPSGDGNTSTSSGSSTSSSTGSGIVELGCCCLAASCLSPCAAFFTWSSLALTRVGCAHVDPAMRWFPPLGDAESGESSDSGASSSEPAVGGGADAAGEPLASLVAAPGAPSMRPMSSGGMVTGERPALGPL